jgi:hypothetical protein
MNRCFAIAENGPLLQMLSSPNVERSPKGHTIKSGGVDLCLLRTTGNTYAIETRIVHAGGAVVMHGGVLNALEPHSHHYAIAIPMLPTDEYVHLTRIT